MFEELKAQALEANLMLPKENLIILTWGNVSCVDRASGVIAIKASGVEYSVMKEEHMVLTDLGGTPLDPSSYSPSTDLDTHVEIYKAFPKANAVVHVHSQFATMWAQAGKGIPCLGTTHADYFYGEIPCTRRLTPDEIKSDYEKNTGKVIVETFEGRDASRIPAALVNSHGPFIWGKSPGDAVHNAMILEYIAKMAYCNHLLCGGSLPLIQDELLDKHYLRKFGENAYYGQRR